MSTLSQDHDVMEMEVQQEEWAKQKTPSGERGGKSGERVEKDEDVHSSAVSPSVSARSAAVGQRGRAVKREKDTWGQRPR